MADSSSSSEEIDVVKNPIQLAINKGATLKEPDRAAISRKRKIVKNKGKYKASRVNNQPKNNTCVWDRIKDFPGQHLVNENGQLWCNACNEIISIKKGPSRSTYNRKNMLTDLQVSPKAKRRTRPFWSV